MKKVSILILLLSLQGVLSGQKSLLPIDTISFILGTLDDYMGRKLYPELTTRIDRFYAYEYPLVRKLDSLITPAAFDYKRLFENDSSGIQLFSKKISILLNSNYDYFDSHSRTMDQDTIYYGKLRNNIFDSDLRKISFLLGAYIRFGDFNGNLYTISIPNSASKIKVCESLLNELKCKDVVYTIKRNYIPVGHSVSFHPTEKLLEYFRLFSYLRNQIQQNFDKKIIEKIN